MIVNMNKCKCGNPGIVKDTFLSSWICKSCWENQGSPDPDIDIKRSKHISHSTTFIAKELSEIEHFIDNPIIDKIIYFRNKLTKELKPVFKVVSSSPRSVGYCTYSIVREKFSSEVSFISRDTFWKIFEDDVDYVISK